MKFTKLGKALLMSALSVGLILGISSCVQSYTVGYLYVTGTKTAQSGNNGIISGFRIDHNTGFLRSIHQFPVSSGGSNPVRAILLPGSRFVYVLNRGVNAQGNSDCSGASGDTVCQNANITQFSVGGNGILTYQATFFTQGFNPFRLAVDSIGGHLLALDHDAPDPAACQLALGPNVANCADVTVFNVDSTTGRLSLVTNAQVTSASGKPLTYFPVPSNPIDFVMAQSFLLTLTGTPAQGDSVFPYIFGASGQLTLSQNSAQPLGIKQATAIVNAAGTIYVLDNESPVSNPNSAAQILPFTVGTGGALQAQPVGVIPDEPSVSDPIYLIQESKNSKFIYIANRKGNPQAAPPVPSGGIAGYSITNSPTLAYTPTVPGFFGTGANPQCLVEDPSNQYIYTANFDDSSVTGRLVDPNAGVLNSMRKGSKWALEGPATWCLVNGRTD